MENNNEQIRQLEEEILRLHQHMTPLQLRISVIQQEIAELNSPFRIGDEVRWKAGRGFRSGKVVRIGRWVCNEPFWEVQVVRKDGSLGGVSKVYPYQNPDKVENGNTPKT